MLTLLISCMVELYGGWGSVEGAGLHEGGGAVWRGQGYVGLALSKGSHNQFSSVFLVMFDVSGGLLV